MRINTVEEVQLTEFPPCNLDTKSIDLPSLSETVYFESNNLPMSFPTKNTKISLRFAELYFFQVEKRDVIEILEGEIES